ncbi:glycosyltransferase [Loktanella sp. SALINAS62]|uniref:glycosyltransferase family 2 protein n=1 Tax=Loktanella sp. SALINAS62 TaxID=2706124 RepID=UPI001B8CE2FF|nr:glycosyltransferase [Loktanella sp. SALINAS62]MBS1302741.1 glycosyltransferase [Loktanella sp. SALINAS62]
MGVSELDISIIICTCDRPMPLMRCLKSIANAMNETPGLTVEIVVVENGSSDGLRLDEMGVRQAGGSCVRLIQLPSGGLAQARNEGMRMARGRIFVFTDDDCIMDRNYLRDLSKHDCEASGDMFIGGRVKLADATDLEFTIKNVPERELFEVHIHPGGFLQGCNLAIARDTAKKIGEFDTRFGAGSPLKAGEDTDYMIRAHIAGMRIEYVPDMSIYHKHGRKLVRQVQELNHQYAFANGAIYAKYLLRQPWLLKRFFWTARAAAIERFLGGPKFNDGLGLTWGSLLKSHLMGFIGYFAHALTAPRHLTKRR